MAVTLRLVKDDPLKGRLFDKVIQDINHHPPPESSPRSESKSLLFIIIGSLVLLPQK